MASASATPATLKDLCTAAGFAKVVYVDDYFARSLVRMQAMLDELPLAKVIGISRLGLSPADEAPDEDTVRAEAKRALETVVESGHADPLFDELAAAMEGANLGAEDALAVSQFAKALGDIAPVTVLRLSMGEWRRQGDGLLDLATKGSTTLFVFDDDFKLEDLPTDAGRNELLRVTARLGTARHAAVLLTHKAQDEKTEIEVEAEILAGNQDGAERVVVVGKGPLRTSTVGLVRRVKYAMLKSAFLTLKGHVRAAVEESAKAAVDYVDGMGVDEFERIIVHSSMIEGAWSPETMTRVLSVGQEKRVRRNLRSAVAVHQVVSSIEPLAGIDTGSPATSVRDRAYVLQRAEVLDLAADLEGLYLPLDLGDVFELGPKRFVLIAQSCDVAIRQAGDRSRDEDRLVALAEIRTKGGPPIATGIAPVAAGTPSASEAETDADSEDTEFRIEHIEADGASAAIHFNRVTMVPTWILDFVVYSPTGECQLASDAIAPNNMATAWKQRLGILKQRIAKTVVGPYVPLAFHTDKQIKAAETKAKDAGLVADPALGETERVKILQGLLRLPLGAKLKPVLESKPDGSWKLTLGGLRRTQRIRERHAAALLAAFGHFGSRPAYPHELTRFQP